MSAANPSYDLDALHRAQRAYEPSMEEILASIRNIISEERPGMGALPGVPAGRPAPAAEPSPPPVVERQEPAERVEPVAAAMPRVVWPIPEPEPERAPEPSPTPPPVSAVESAPAQETIGRPETPPAEDPDNRLISPEANVAIAHSFDALSVSVAVQNSSVIEDTVREMIRPMLKAWLDDHLPSMVENLVRAEIQRVARGGR